MKQVLTFINLVLLSNIVFAQTSVYTRLSDGNTFFYYGTNQLPLEVVADATPGDTIILPGGQISVPNNWSIQKRLVWVGAGYRPDTNVVTTRTEIAFAVPASNDHVFVQEGASGSRFHGIHFNRIVSVSNSSAFQPVVDDVRFERCEFNKSLRLNRSSLPPGAASSNITLHQCVMKSGVSIIVAGNPNPVLGFSANNCIIEGSINFGSSTTNALVNNCIFLTPDFSSTSRNSGLVYTNCIFTKEGNNWEIENPSVFQHCLFAQSGGTQVSWGPNAVNGVGNQTSLLTAGNVFQNVPVWDDFSYAYDYRLTVSPPSPALNMGGTQSGVYGGSPLAVWKQGGIPFNPHWISLTTEPVTNGGTISISLEGAAQEN